MKILKDESGNFLILGVFSVLGILLISSIVLDLGRVYMEKQRLYNSYDAAALAGAQRMVEGQTDWENTARKIIGDNGQEETVKNSTSITSPSSNTIEVEGEKIVPLLTTQLINLKTIKVAAKVKATAGTVVSAKGIMPIAIIDKPDGSNDYEFDKEYALTRTAQNNASGNFGFLDCDGNGSKGVAEFIKQGCELSTSVPVDTETGNNAMSNNVKTALKEKEGTLIYVPMVESIEVNGKKEVNIIGFAAFEYIGINDQNQLVGKFVRKVIPGELGNSRDFGAKSINLQLP